MKKSCFSVFLVAMIFTANAQMNLTNGLVAYYPFNGNANDASGNTNHGVISGATWTNGILGTATNALFFNGASRVVVSDNPSLNPTNAITLSAWFKANNWNGNNRIINKGDLQYQLTAQYGSFMFEIVNASNVDFQVSAASPSVGLWHNAVGTYDGGAMRLYIDGVLVSTKAANGLIATTNLSGNPNVNLNIGAKSDSANPIDFFSGSICKVRIYNRALSSNEVAQLLAYESGFMLELNKAVFVSSDNLDVGANYQVQVSSDLINWTNQGAVFTATNTSWQSTNFWPVASWNQFFFRLVQQ
jgi:hypothetical protein